MLARAKAAKDAAEAERAKFGGKGDKNGRGRNDRGVTPEVLRKPIDIRDDPKYQGQTTFMIKFIPFKCVDERTEVTEDALREWILCAIVEEDPYSKRFFQEIHRIHAVIAEIDGHLRQIPKLAFLDEDGQPMTDEKSRIERELIFNKYSDDRARGEDDLLVAQGQLQAHIDWRRKMGIDFVKGTWDRNTDTMTWYMNMSGTNDVAEIEDLLIRKQNWPGIKLAMGHHQKSIPPWAGRGELPNGSKANQHDYSNLQVGIAGARFLRVPSGVGLMQQLDRTSTSIYGEEFSFFYGEFESGLKHGYGIDISDEGVYGGSHENGYRRGHGRMDYADGTTVIGTFGMSSQHKPLETTQFQNPYREGEADGLVEINFGDGGFYRGHMTNGRITGQGDYQSAFNEVLSGNFVDGALHCDKGFMQNQAEDVYTGTFRHGELHGKGTFLSRRKDSYDGYWEHFLRHGRGVSRTGEMGEYRGYFINNLKHGKGSVSYGNVAKRAAAKKQREEDRKRAEETAKEEQARAKAAASATSSPDKAAGRIKAAKAARETSRAEADAAAAASHANKPVSDFDNIFLGYLLGNGICNGGCVMNTVVQVPGPISRLNKRACYPIFRELNRDVRHNKQSSRLQEKCADMEQHIRDEMSAKKIKIFRQQKHFTKKTMYADETTFGGIDYGELKSKLFLRQERLKNMKEESHQFKKAVVPRLRFMNNKSHEVMSKAYGRIHPDPLELRDMDRINDDLVKIAISDFEEVQERHRFLKYDLIWQRAENAYADAHKSATDGAADNEDI